MSNLRKLLASALSSSDLSPNPLEENALDRLGAIAWADALGESLWRLKWGNEAAQAPIARERLSLRCKSIIQNIDLRRRLCGLVIHEWLDDSCHSCGGRRFIMATDSTPTSVCTTCNGTGAGVRSDQSRMSHMQFSAQTYRKWERRFAQVHQRVSDADFQAWRDVALKLERIGGHRMARKVLEFSKKRFILCNVASDGPRETKNYMPGTTVCSTASA